MRLRYGTSAYERNNGDLPELPLINMYVEKTASEDIVLQSRRGFSLSNTWGTGSVDGILKRAGLFSESVFTVNGTDLLKDGTSLGTIDGTGAVSFAYTGDDTDADDDLIIARGGSIWRYTASGLAEVTFPDDQNVVKVGFLSDFFLAVPENSQRFYFSATLDGSSWDGLDYATAQKEPDQILDMVVLNDMLVFLGARTIEFWQSTGDSLLPFAPITGRVVDRGIHSTGCAQNIDNTVYWIGDDSIVYRLGDAGIPKAVSDQGIEERILASATAALWQFDFEGNKFLCVRTDAETLALNVRTGQWSEFASYGKDNFLAQCEDGGLFGSSEDGGILEFNTLHTDLDGVLERRFRAGFPVDGGGLKLSNLRLRTNAGNTPYLASDYANPLVEMRFSRDTGKTWADWRSTSLGAQGDYRTRIEWRALGMFDDPGGLFEFRVTDPVPFGVRAVAANEARGGRSR